jgi:hypothetical protein
MEFPFRGFFNPFLNPPWDSDTLAPFFPSFTRVMTRDIAVSILTAWPFLFVSVHFNVHSTAFRVDKGLSVSFFEQGQALDVAFVVGCK